jgi:hypothetical protein
MHDNIYLKSVLHQVPRLLTQLNRNCHSKSYGSFDRNYWHYKTNDISCARFQEAGKVLALLYVTKFKNNIYYQSHQIEAYLNACLNFTAKIQNSDGSYNEWYINEGSYVCSSFVSEAIADILILLGRKKIKNYNKIITSLKKTAKWLCSNEELSVINQYAGSILALRKIYRLTKDKNLLFYESKKLKKILDLQNLNEGWWPEYGGPDIGYLSVTIDYLSEYYNISKSNKLLRPLKLACNYIQNFLQPNFSAGGHYMSRNTEYLHPAGFARLFKKVSSAKKILNFCSLALEKEIGVIPKNLDDRYLCYILSSWLKTGVILKSQSRFSNKILFSRINNYFSNSQIISYKNGKTIFNCNLKKGGSFIYFVNNKYYSDSGLKINYRNNLYSTGVINKNLIIRNNTNYYSCKGCFSKINDQTMHTNLMIVFKLFQLIFGKLNFVQKFLKLFLRNKLIIFNQTKKNFFFKRTIIIKKKYIKIIDIVKCKFFNPINIGEDSIYAQVPSSKIYFNNFSKINIQPIYKVRSLNNVDYKILIRKLNLG